MLFGFLVAKHANKKRSRVLYRLALISLMLGVLTFVFFRVRHDFHPFGESSFYISLRVLMSVAWLLLAAVLFCAGVIIEPEFEVNTKQIFSANSTEFTVVLSYPAERYLTIRWAHVKEITASDNKLFRFAITSDFMDLEENSDIDALLIDDICFSKDTPGFALIEEFIPAHKKLPGMRRMKKKKSARYRKKR